MARQISGLRVGRSFLSALGGAVISAELDFQLGSNQGIEISAVLGYGSFGDDSPAASDTVPVTTVGVHTLHMETGTLEDLPINAGDDEVDIDTEIFYAQSYGLMFQIPATAGGGGGGLSVTPSGLVVFAQPIRTARNITHRADTPVTGTVLDVGVLIYYNYIEFTQAELGFFLARRQ